MYNLREACKHGGTIAKPIEYEQDLALRLNYPLLHHEHANAPIIPSLTPTKDASRYSPLYFPPLHIQLQ